ncbi:V-type ATP synthase subunit F [bacterium BMS3Abin03]|nr:V-type ATP synthase subunit F [bacterium BMS3Abin03]HDZ58549.1 hypothetical protein [Ignavibacteriales bacterium]
MSKIAVIADQYTADVFQLTDFDVEITNEQKALEMIIEKSKQDYSIIFISDNLTKNIEEELGGIKQTTNAVIVIIPGMGSRQFITNEAVK